METVFKILLILFNYSLTGVVTISSIAVLPIAFIQEKVTCLSSGR